MKSLAIDKESDDVLRTLCHQHLPVSVQKILSISKYNLNDLAKIADKIYDFPGLIPVLSDVKMSDISREINV